MKNNLIISRYDIEKVMKCITYNNDQKIVLSKSTIGKTFSDYDKSVINDDLNDYIKKGLSKELSEELIRRKYKLKEDERT